MYFLNTHPLSDIWFINIFSPPLACLFIFIMVSFEIQKFGNLMRSNLLFFTFMDHAFGIIPKKPLPNPSYQDFLLYFLLKDFFQLLHLWPWSILSKFLCMVWGKGLIPSFSCISNCASIMCWKDYPFPQWIALAPLWNISLTTNRRVYFETLNSVPFFYSLFLCQYHIILISVSL